MVPSNENILRHLATHLENVVLRADREDNKWGNLVVWVRVRLVGAKPRAIDCNYDEPI